MPLKDLLIQIIICIVIGDLLYIIMIPETYNHQHLLPSDFYTIMIGDALGVMIVAPCNHELYAFLWSVGTIHWILLYIVAPKELYDIYRFNLHFYRLFPIEWHPF